MAEEKSYTPLADIDAVMAILNRISLFGGLTDDQLRILFAYLEQVSYRKDQIIFRQGEKPGHIYIIESGCVKIVLDANGTPLELHAYGVGACFGETAAIGLIPHSATAIAVEDTTLIVLPAMVLHTLYTEDPKLFGMLILNIARESCRRLHQTDEILLHYAAQPRR